MLDKVRKNVKSFGVQIVIIVVVAAFIGTIFLVWGHGGKQERQGTVLAKIYDINVTIPEYQHEYSQLVKQYRQMYKDQWSEEVAERLKLKQLAFNNLINQYILLHKAYEWGIQTSNQEVMEYIRSLPIFQMEGGFNENTYRRRLEMANISPESFEHDIRNHLIFNKIQERITAGYKVTDNEVLDKFVQEHEKIKADYLLFTIERFMANIQLNLDTLKGYFQSHNEQYQQPEKRTVEYLFLNPRDFEADANVTANEINIYYDQHEKRFTMTKQVKASHILLKVNPGTSAEEEAKIKEKALGLLERIKAGEDFHELAKTYSECPSAPKGGDLGYFTKGKMDPEFEKTAFSLNIGEVSQVIKSSFGYHIIKVEDIKPEHVRPLDEVKAEIIREIKKEKGKELAMEKADFLIREIYRGQFLRDFAFEDRINFKEEGPFSKEEPLPGIGSNKEVMDEIFGLEEGKVSRILNTPKGVYIFKLVKIVPPRDSTYEEVETKVELDVKREEAKKKAHEEAEKSRERLFHDPNLGAIAKEYSLTVSETGEFGYGQYISGVGSLDDKQMQELFSLPRDGISPVIETPHGFVIFKIKDKIGINQEEFAQQKDSLKTRLLKIKQQELFNTWIERVKKQANIEVYNEDFIEKKEETT